MAQHMGYFRHRRTASGRRAGANINAQTPEDIGLRPDGDPPLERSDELSDTNATPSTDQRRTLTAETSWNRSEVIRLPTFWLLVVTFGIASVGIAGLNLHIFSYVTDIGYSPLIAASFMSTIALTQLGSTLV
jgi:hypothetical protein